MLQAEAHRAEEDSRTTRNPPLHCQEASEGKAPRPDRLRKQTPARLVTERLEPPRRVPGASTTLSGRRPPRDELVSGLAVPGCTGAEGTRGNVDLGHRPDAQTPTAPLPSALQPGWPKAQGLSTLAARQAPIQRLVSQAALRERVWNVGSGAWPTT